jgi:hypothetical protein
VACAPALDTACIITKIASVREARALPGGCVVGDQHGGLTFSDAVAAELEARSLEGWREVRCGGEIWTVILLN